MILDCWKFDLNGFEDSLLKMTCDNPLYRSMIMLMMMMICELGAASKLNQRHGKQYMHVYKKKKKEESNK